jgi:hypothetical protein
MKKISILTGGGDCPGLNPVIRGVVRKAIQSGLEVYGFQNGWKGLMENDVSRNIGLLPGVATYKRVFFHDRSFGTKGSGNGSFSLSNFCSRFKSS